MPIFGGNVQSNVYIDTPFTYYGVFFTPDTSLYGPKIGIGPSDTYLTTYIVNKD